MDLEVVKSACLLPSIMKRLEDNLLALEVKAILDIGINDNLLMDALTFNKSNVPTTMEAMVLYGVDFLNLMVLFIPYLGGSQSSIRPSYLQSNKYLTDLAQRLGISNRINARDLDKGWVPPNFFVNELGRTSHHKAKSLVDTMEAILGAALLSGGESLGIQCLISFGIWPESINAWPQILRSLSFVSCYTYEQGLNQTSLTHLEATIGYKFYYQTNVKNMMLKSSSGVLSTIVKLDELLFKFTATRFLIEKFPCLFPGFYNNQIDLFRSPDSYTVFQSLADVISGVQGVLTGVKSVYHGFIILKKLIKSVFLDSHLHFSEIHRLFHPIYASILANGFHNPCINPDKANITVARLFFQARCCGLKAVYSEPSATGEFTCRLLIHNQTYITEVGNSKTKALYQALKSFIINHPNPDFIKGLCNCKNVGSIAN